MNTVLPTPAPPKRPILPPRAYGARRSTTLIPVTRISAVVDCSVNSGASAWMGAYLVALMGPRSSMGSPVTLTIRPRVPGPTGMVMGAPVSRAGAPRVRPSVPRMGYQYLEQRHGDHTKCSRQKGSYLPSIAMVRTTFSPKCCFERVSHRNLVLSIGFFISNTYSNLENELLAVVLGLNGVENGGKLLTLELHCDSQVRYQLLTLF